jgi:hypothetical protein
MSWITKGTKQKLVHWAANTLDGYGNTDFATAVELDGRAEDKEEEVLIPEGEKLLSRTIAYFDGDPGIGNDDRVLVGELADLDSADLSNPPEESLRVLKVMNSPAFKGSTVSLTKIFLR